MFLRIIKKICKIMHVSVLYHTRVGIKSTNQLISSDIFNYIKPYQELTLNEQDLLLGSDGLKDEFTLLNTPIDKSPHYDFMKRLYNNNNIDDCPYVNRMINGTLDFRNPISRKVYSKRDFRSKFNKRLSIIDKEVYEPVKVMNLQGKYYILDGKHTAALCVLLGKDVECIDISAVAYDSFSWWIYEKIKKKPKLYQKQLTYYKELKNVNINKSSLTKGKVKNE